MVSGQVCSLQLYGWIFLLLLHIVVGLSSAKASTLNPAEIPNVCTKDPTEVSRAEGYEASALGLDGLSRGDLETAVQCLTFAHRAFPTSEVIARDLALAQAQSNQLEQARTTLNRAVELGDYTGDLERALIYAELSQPSLALSAARAAGGIEGVSVAALLGDDGALRFLGQALELKGAEQSLVHLILAAHLAKEGALGAALRLAQLAQLDAQSDLDPLLLNTARLLSRRLAQQPRTRMHSRVEVFAEYVVNPSWRSDRAGMVRDAWATRLVGDLNLSGHWGLAQWVIGGALDQRLFLNDQSFSDVERLGILGYGQLYIPLSRDLRSTAVRISLRATDVWSNGIRINLGSELGGGASLDISMAQRWRAELGVYGVWSNFEEPSDPRARIRDRDRLGHRVRGALRYLGEKVFGDIELVAINDEAEGQDFDSVGVSMAGHLGVRLNLWTFQARVSGLLRRLGPVGDIAVIGESAQREELRWTSHLSVFRPIYGVLDWVLDSSLVRNEAQSAASYSSHTLSTGVRGRW